MGQYLDSFKGTIGKRQAEQIVKLLNKKRNAGQIRSIVEFQDQLEQLMYELTSTVLQPTLKLYLGTTDEEIASEGHNFMLDRVEDDLQAAFEESLKIDEVQRSHEGIIRDVTLKNLQAGVAELESKISLFEFLNQDLRGFDSAIFSTFRESKEGRTQRGTKLTQALFVDPRKLTTVPAENDSTVELIGERLTLPVKSTDFHEVKFIRQIFDDEAVQTEFEVKSLDSNLNNIIDNTKGTYWTQSLISRKKKEQAKVKLELDFGRPREINFLEIEPACRGTIVLESIHYLDNSGIFVDLGLEEESIDSSVGIKIKKIATSKMILTFRSQHIQKTSFEYEVEGEKETREILVPEERVAYEKKIRTNTYKLSDRGKQRRDNEYAAWRRGGKKRREPYWPLFVDSLTKVRWGGKIDFYSPAFLYTMETMYEIIPSRTIRREIWIRKPRKEIFQGYEFLLGFDNIRVCLSSYKEEGIYISEPLEITNIREVGLRAAESRPYRYNTETIVRHTDETYDNDVTNEIVWSGSTPVSGRVFFGSIEYWVIKQDLTSKNTLSSTTVFPILPLGVERIHQEQLVLTEKSVSTLNVNDTGQTMFFTNDDTTEGNIKIYRNGLPLVQDTDWSDISVDLDKRPNASQGMRFRIKISAPLAGDIFTVSYNPLASTTRVVPKDIDDYTDASGLKVVDLTGNLGARMGSGNLVILDKPGEEEKVVKSRAFLAIVLRQNTSESSLTPAVEEYTLVAGYKDKSKFEED